MMLSELERLVVIDMMEHGYDYRNPEHIMKYWSERLS